MLLIGNQLKAARALAGVEQQQLADRAEVHVNTIRAMEAKGREEITSAATVLRRVEKAMESFGVRFTNGVAPGVQLAEPADSSTVGHRSKNVPIGRRRSGEDQALPAFAGA